MGGLIYHKPTMKGVPHMRYLTSNMSRSVPHMPNLSVAQRKDLFRLESMLSSTQEYTQLPSAYSKMTHILKSKVFTDRSSVDDASNHIESLGVLKDVFDRVRNHLKKEMVREYKELLADRRSAEVRGDIALVEDLEDEIYFHQRDFNKTTDRLKLIDRQYRTEINVLVKHKVSLTRIR
jgi:hypothetical protein